MNHVDKTAKGFTLVELMLAMAFVSFLLMAIALTVIQLGNIYSKGVTLKEVNQSGQALSQDIQIAIGASRPLSVGEGGSDYKTLKAADGKVAGARLCTGTYSYIWNLGAYMEAPVNAYASGTNVIRLVKVDDRGKAYCNDVTKKVVVNDATELLTEGDRSLALQGFTITQIANDSVLQQALYRITLELGTNDRDLLQSNPEGGGIDTVDTSCRPPSDGGARQEYCAVNKFEFTARAGNKGEL